MSQENNSDFQFENIISNSNLIELTSDYAELIIDKIVDDGFLKDIPVIGSIINVVKFGNSVNQHFFAKKIYKFLFELKSIPPEKRKKKLQEINDSKKYQSSVGEIILEFIDKIESDYKPEILGKLFKAYIEEKIDFQTYLRLVHIMKSIFIYDILELKKSIIDNKYCTYSCDQFVIMGLIKIDFVTPFENALNGIEQEKYTELSELGINLNNYGLQ